MSVSDARWQELTSVFSGGVQVLKCYSFQVKDLFLVNFYMKLENIFCNSSSILNSVHPDLWQHYPLSWKCALLRWEDFLLCG